MLDEAECGRAAAFHSRVALRLREKRMMLNALLKTLSILDEAGVPYTYKRVFGRPVQTIAEYAAKDQADIVLLDAGSMGFFRRWGMFAKLWRLCKQPVTMIH